MISNRILHLSTTGGSGSDSGGIFPEGVKFEVETIVFMYETQVSERVRLSRAQISLRLTLSAWRLAVGDLGLRARIHKTQKKLFIGWIIIERRY